MREKEKGKEKESGGEIEREIVGEMGGERSSHNKTRLMHERME
jgi:hypothetical protein